jgi:hypothetical protein
MHALRARYLEQRHGCTERYWVRQHVSHRHVRHRGGRYRRHHLPTLRTGNGSKPHGIVGMRVDFAGAESQALRLDSRYADYYNASASASGHGPACQVRAISQAFN